MDPADEPGRQPTDTRRMPRAERQRMIVDYVVGAGSASAAELAELAAVSVMTVHRDIHELAGRGVLRKYHGGVSAQPSTVFESSSDFRLHSNIAAKEALAHAALPRISAGSSVLLDDSTTSLALARLLPRVGPLTVVTNYRQAIEQLRSCEDIRLIVIGGEYSRSHDSYLGLAAQEMIATFSVDVAVQSSSGMSATMTYHQESEMVQLKRTMMDAAVVNMLLMDSTKVGRTAMHQLVPVSRFDHIFVTSPVDPTVITALREATDVTVVSAPTAHTRR